MLALIAIAIAFGVVEGITEWLPISSTGHLILLEGIFSASGYDLSSNLGFSHGDEFISVFLVVIQLGAILAVVCYFFNRLWPWSRKQLSEDELSLVEQGYHEDVIQRAKRRQVYGRWGKCLVGVIPAGVVGLLFELTGWEEAMNNWITVSVTLVVYGVFFILIELLLKSKPGLTRTNDVDGLSYKTAFLIGVTIIGALLLGCSRVAAAEFSFYLSIPVMVGASLLKLVTFFIDSGAPDLNEVVFLIVGMAVSFTISLFAVKWLMGFVKKHSFSGFGYYRIALGLLVIVFFSTVFGLGKMPLI